MTLVVVALSLLAVCSLQGSDLEPLSSGVDASLRGLSVIDDRVAWASGADGWVGVTRDAGESWSFARVAGHEQRDFRDVEAFSAQRALIVAVGSPGLVLETTDGGASWSERFRDDRPEIFLDGIECDHWTSPPRCFVFGDPIGGRFVLLASADGGESWSELAGPEALPGEAAFAASGTSIRIAPNGEVAIGTGGAASARVLRSSDWGRTWRAEAVPLAAGAATRGVFSLAPTADGGWIAVGGDYGAETATAGTAARGAGAGPSWELATAPPGGYRSAVDRLGDGRLISTGPGGTDASDDDGRTWRPISTLGFHAVRRSKHGGLVLLAGANGRLARLAGR
jgi:photosystem II stability/assembly factor-like uncharacterized protein